MDKYREAIETFIEKANKVNKDWRKDKTPSLVKEYGNEDQIEGKFGRKYDKIIKNHNNGQTTVVCFVEKKTGDILKPAGWKAPMKGARGNIYQPESYKDMDPHGSWLYKIFGNDFEVKRHKAQKNQED